MRKFVVSLAAASLALSMLAQAIPAAAVSGYDSSYAGESAFVALSAGQSNEFQVFFANTGATTWTRGTGTQVDLAACLSDKVTCNAQDASDATWNAGWLSSSRYATTVQTSVAPGAVATFRYTVTAPSGVAQGEYDFNGDLVLSNTGEKIHPEGYYQAATVGTTSGAPTITSLTPNSGPTGQDVIVAGSGFVCTPAFPTASFGGTTAATLSCGASTITVDAPAHALGSVTVTVSNSGSPASNGLTYTYTDVTGPTFTSMTITGDLLNVTFNEPVCGTYNPGDWNVQNISQPGTDYLTGSTSNLPTDCTKAVSTFSIFLASSVPNGAFVEATLVNGAATTDASGNAANAPQSRQATATAPETTKPTLLSATGAVGQPNVTLTFSEPVYCDVGQPIGTDFTIDNQNSTTDPTVLAVGDTNACGASRSSADSSFNIHLSQNLQSNATYAVTINAGAAGDIQDPSGNTLTVPTTVTFSSGAGDFTPPTMTDARMGFNAGPSSDFVEGGDSFTVTFSETMNAATNGTISIQDQDGTSATITCSAVSGANQATCSWNDPTNTVMTVTLQGTLGNTAVGSTFGMQVPFNITALTGITDTTGNPPNVLGSADRLVDYE